MTAVLTRQGRAPAPLRAVDEVLVTRSELLARKAIVAADPYLAGHYPGAPIYPGVFVVETVLQAVRRLVGEPVEPVALDAARFTAPLLPGDTLTASLGITRVGGGYGVSARCTRADGALAARVTMTCAPPSAPEAAEAADAALVVAPRAARPGPRPADVLPHRAPMLLVDDIAHVEPGARITTRRVVDAAEPCFADGPGPWPPTLLLESFVQSAAALFLLSRPRTGTLVLGSARDVRWRRPVAPGATLTHVATLDRLAGDRAVLSGATWADGAVCLTAGAVVAAVLGGRP